jgi:hypothetical protein
MTDILHRATLIKRALSPIYNHVFMVLTDQEKVLGQLYKEILLFLWSNTVDQETIQKKDLYSVKDSQPVLIKGD